MSFDPISFLDSHNIDYQISGKHSSHGWANIECPMCTGNLGYHGGFVVNDERFETGSYKCWRCGWHWAPKIVAALINGTITQAKHEIKKHKTFSQTIYKSEKKQPAPLKIDVPGKALQKIHLDYLKKRGFDRSIIKQYNLKGTIGGSYSYRIIAPIYLDGQLISYQGRDITDQAKLKYKGCSREKEIYPHGSSIYNIDNVKGDTILIVEGITDVWKLGNIAGAVFGIGIKLEQVKLIAERFKNYFILFDNDPQAQEEAEGLHYQLQGMNLNGEIITLDDKQDPGELNQKEVEQLKKELGL